MNLCIIKQVIKMYPYHNVIKKRIKNGELVGRHVGVISKGDLAAKLDSLI